MLFSLIILLSALPTELALAVPAPGDPPPSEDSPEDCKMNWDLGNIFYNYDEDFKQAEDILLSKNYRFARENRHQKDITFFLTAYSWAHDEGYFSNASSSRKVVLEIGLRRYNLAGGPDGIIWSKNIEGEFYCRQWQGLRAHYSGLEGNWGKIIMGSFEAINEWRHRCDGQKTPDDFIRTRIREIFLKQLKKLPDCQEAKNLDVIPDDKN